MFHKNSNLLIKILFTSQPFVLAQPSGESWVITILCSEQFIYLNTAREAGLQVSGKAGFEILHFPGTSVSNHSWGGCLTLYPSESQIA